MPRGITVRGASTRHARSLTQTCFFRTASPAMPLTKSTWQKRSAAIVQFLASASSLPCARFRTTGFGAGEAKRSAGLFVGRVEQQLGRLPQGPSELGRHLPRFSGRAKRWFERGRDLQASLVLVLPERCFDHTVADCEERWSPKAHENSETLCVRLILSLFRIPDGDTCGD
jgi:hypothetical protein